MQIADIHTNTRNKEPQRITIEITYITQMVFTSFSGSI